MNSPASPDWDTRFELAQDRAGLPALLRCPAEAQAGCVLAHGAGAGFEHPFLEGVATALAHEGIATLRFLFPYWARGSKRPDPPAVLMESVRQAVDAARCRHPDLSWFAGGKSMGGRMTTLTAAAEKLPVDGIVLLGFPLHPAGRESTTRGDHLQELATPLLFLQGTRDRLCNLDLLRPILKPMRNATLEIVDGADHGFHVPKRSGRSDEEVIADLGRIIAQWIRCRR